MIATGDKLLIVFPSPPLCITALFVLLLPRNLIVILFSTPGKTVQFINDSPRVIRGENCVKVEIDFKLSEAVSRAECKFGNTRTFDCKCIMCVHNRVPWMCLKLAC